MRRLVLLHQTIFLMPTEDLINDKFNHPCNLDMNKVSGWCGLISPQQCIGSPTRMSSLVAISAQLLLSSLKEFGAVVILLTLTE